MKEVRKSSRLVSDIWGNAKKIEIIIIVPAHSYHSPLPFGCVQALFKYTCSEYFQPSVIFSYIYKYILQQTEISHRRFHCQVFSDILD